MMLAFIGEGEKRNPLRHYLRSNKRAAEQEAQAHEHLRDPRVLVTFPGWSITSGPGKSDLKRVGGELAFMRLSGVRTGTVKLSGRRQIWDRRRASGSQRRTSPPATERKLGRETFGSE